MRKRFLIGIIIGLLICLTGCTVKLDNKQASFLSEADLEDSTMYVHNVTCPEVHEMRTVMDEEFLKKIIEASITVEPFRPVILTDVILGEKPEAYYVLDNGETEYRFSFFEVQKQLDIEFVHRDRPMITVAKTTAEETTQIWFCTLSAADYAALYEMVQTYTGGEIEHE